MLSTLHSLLRWGETYQTGVQETELSNARFSPFREVMAFYRPDILFSWKELPYDCLEVAETARVNLLRSGGVLLSLFGSHLKPYFSTSLINNKANFFFTPHLFAFSDLSLHWLQNLDGDMIHLLVLQTHTCRSR